MANNGPMIPKMMILIMDCNWFRRWFSEMWLYDNMKLKAKIIVRMMTRPHSPKWGGNTTKHKDIKRLIIRYVRNGKNRSFSGIKWWSIQETPPIMLSLNKKTMLMISVMDDSISWALLKNTLQGFKGTIIVPFDAKKILIK